MLAINFTSFGNVLESMTGEGLQFAVAPRSGATVLPTPPFWVWDLCEKPCWPYAVVK